MQGSLFPSKEMLIVQLAILRPNGRPFWIGYHGVFYSKSFDYTSMEHRIVLIFRRAADFFPFCQRTICDAWPDGQR